METFERKAYEELASWKESSQGSTALLIEGARRVGKSTIAEEFGRRNYASYMLVDFSKAPDDVLGYFVDLRNDLDAFFMYLSSFYGVELHRRDSLIIFDEVQLYPKAREAIKQLVADGRYDYIETGSLVSIRENVKDILIPSEEESIRLNPMDFDEFLWALGEKPLSTLIADSFKKRRPLPDSLHRKAMRLFREYMLVGGMPQAVSKYVETHDFSKVDNVTGKTSPSMAAVTGYVSRASSITWWVSFPRKRRSSTSHRWERKRKPAITRTPSSGFPMRSLPTTVSIPPIRARA